MSSDSVRRTSSGRPLYLVTPGARREDEVVDASVCLPAQRRSVAAGRHWVVKEAADLGITGMANQVLELLTSELLANAVLHGPDGQDIGLRLRYCDDRVEVAVTDRAVQPPVVLHAEPTAPSGRGMAIVEAMSSRWGVDELAQGKSVWFELDLDEY